MRSYAISTLFGLLFVLAMPTHAYLPTTHIVDMAHRLELKTHDELAMMLSRVTQERAIHITVCIVNDAKVVDLTQYGERWVKEYELRLSKENFLQKRIYLMVDANSKQALILLGKAVILDEASLEGLQEIQQKILVPHLQQDHLNTAVKSGTIAMLSALEEWPVKSLLQPSRVVSSTFLNVLKWFALLGLGYAGLMLLRTLFHRPHWRELPIASEPSLQSAQERSLEMAYWRSHLHIPEL